jgi:hypothetical protein
LRLPFAFLRVDERDRDSSIIALSESVEYSFPTEARQIGPTFGQGSERVIEIYQQPPLSVTQSGWHFFAEG